VTSPPTLRFGISTHLFHGERLTRAHLEAIAARGFADLEIVTARNHFDCQDPAAIEALAGWRSDLGLSVRSLRTPAMAESSAAIAAARRLGASTVVVAPAGPPHGQAVPPGPLDQGARRRALERLAEEAAVAGVRIALEVMPHPMSTPAALVELVDALDSVTIGTCLDLGHAHLLDGAPEAAETLSGHVIAVHLHDNRGRQDDHLVPFEGTVDWPAALTALWKVGYAGPLVFEVAGRADAPEVLDRAVGARTRLQAILDGLSEPFAFVERE
jgi:sugar phosphate isomerase/epimerase